MFARTGLSILALVLLPLAGSSSALAQDSAEKAAAVTEEDGKWFEDAVDGPLISNQKEVGVQAAVDGVGIAFASRQLIDSHIAEGRLVALLEAWSAPFPGYYLCYPAQRQMAPPLRALIDTIRATRA